MQQARAQARGGCPQGGVGGVFVADKDVVVGARVGEVVEVVGHIRIVRVGKAAFVLQRAPDEGGRAAARLQEDGRAAARGERARKDGGRVDEFAAAEDEDTRAATNVARVLPDGGGKPHRLADTEAAKAAVGNGNGRFLHGGDGRHGGGRFVMPAAAQQAVPLYAVGSGRAEIGEREPVRRAQGGQVRAQRGGEGAESVAGGEFVVNQHQALYGGKQAAVGGQVQPLLRGVAVAFFKGADGGIPDAQAAGVQVERGGGGAGGKPGFKDALRQCGGGFRHADEEDGGGQAGGQFGGEQAVDAAEGRDRHGDVFAQHFADEEEGAARIGARTEGEEFVRRQVGVVNAEAEGAVGQAVGGHGGVSD